MFYKLTQYRALLNLFFQRKLAYCIIGGHCHSHKKFRREGEAILSGALREKYDKLVLQYPTKKDFKKAHENIGLFVEMIYRLGLPEMEPLSMLDTGSRGGLFPFFCRHYGHHAIGTDLAEVLEEQPNKALFELYEIEALPLCIEAKITIPDFYRKFDLITGFRTRFHSKMVHETGLDHELHWGVEEWDFFLRDLANNQLSERGRIFFLLNRLQEIEKGRWMPEELYKYFKSVGGNVEYNMLYFKDLHLLRK